MRMQHFFDSATSTLSYVVWQPETKDAVIIDPVLDYDLATDQTSERSAQNLLQFLQQHQLKLLAILETHAHADHLSSSQFLKKSFPAAKIAVSKRMLVVQETFKKLLKVETVLPSGTDFDLLLEDHQSYQFGAITFKVIPTPGHTPACTSFLFGDWLFTGDALFMPDSGTGRCDFPGGSAHELYLSIQQLYQLPESTQVFVGHDYQPNQRELRFQTTIGESKKKNIHIKSDTSEASFVQFRQERDKTLAAPKLLVPSLKRNIVAGKG